jgi:hypothetical protein
VQCDKSSFEVRGVDNSGSPSRLNPRSMGRATCTRSPVHAGVTGAIKDAMERRLGVSNDRPYCVRNNCPAVLDCAAASAGAIANRLATTRTPNPSAAIIRTLRQRVRCSWRTSASSPSSSPPMISLHFASRVLRSRARHHSLPAEHSEGHRRIASEELVEISLLWTRHIRRAA